MNWIIYIYPLVFDIIVGLTLFAGRHQFGELKLGTATIGSSWLIYGIGYMLCSMFMARIVTPARAKNLMLAGALIAVGVLLGLAHAEKVRLIQVLFCGIPLACSLFFNAYQAYMLGVDTGTRKPLATTIAHYTFAWSIGYAMGPAISAGSYQLGDWLKFRPWTAVYYTAAAITMALGITVFFFKPRTVPADTDSAAPLPGSDGPSFCMPAWIGIVVGLGGWGMITTFWPSHAVDACYSTLIKGAVEFCAAASQGVIALCLGLFVPRWFFKVSNLPLLALAGIAGALCFGFGPHWIMFAFGAALYGIYSAGYFSYLPFHAMLDPAKAVHRVAVNETLVGLGFLIGPLLALLADPARYGYAAAYSAAAVWIALGVTIQTIAAIRIARRGGS